jgi:hypothetical protein
MVGVDKVVVDVGVVVTGYNEKEPREGHECSGGRLEEMSEDKGEFLKEYVGDV